MKNCRAIAEVGQGLQVPDGIDIAVCVNADIACELSPPEYRIKAIVTADECTVTPYDYESDAHLKVRLAVNSFRKLMQL
ncbi:MAG: hypothetical protein LUP91_13160 [Methylococcaceae bacterium]|nr:hypothetical protein [Methylococcaceae bacterium]